MRRIARTAAILVVLGAAVARAQDGPDDVQALERVLALAAIDVGPSVVAVGTASERERDPFRPEAPGARGPGSGLVVDASGWVLTTLGSTGGEDRVVLRTADRRTLPGRVVGRDLRLGIACVRADLAGGPPLHPAALASDVPSPGRFVAVIGALPGAPAAPPVSVDLGIVSATERFGGRFFQSDARIDAANAGGPLVDIDGRVIGLAADPDPTFGDGSGTGFAVPAPLLRRVLPRLRAGETIAPAFLGVEGRARDGGRGGVVVARVLAGSAADRVGLREGDVILAVDSQVVEQPSDLRRAIALAAAGDTVVITFRRGDALATHEAVLGTVP